MKKEVATAQFWVTNVSNRNVSLADLNLTIKAFTSVNLLDKKHYSYTPEQLQTSITSGSLAAKKDKIVPRVAPPPSKKNVVTIDRNAIIPSRERSIFSIKEEYYEELNVSDDDYAKDNADLADVNISKPTPKA